RLEPLAIGTIATRGRVLQTRGIRKYHFLLQPASKDFVLGKTRPSDVPAIKDAQQFIPLSHEAQSDEVLICSISGAEHRVLLIEMDTVIVEAVPDCLTIRVQ